MDESELWNLAIQTRDSLINAAEYIKQLEKKLDDSIVNTDRRFAEADEKINELRTTVYEQIIDPANAYIDEMDRNARFDDFSAKYGEKLSPLNKELSALEGEDFDIVRSAFDEYDGYEGEKMGEDEYVEALIAEVGKKLDAIKKGLGLSPDTEIAVEQTEDGDTVVTTEDGDVISADGETETEAEAEAEEEAPVEEEVEVEEEPVDDPEEIAAFEEELKNQK